MRGVRGAAVTAVWLVAFVAWSVVLFSTCGPASQDQGHPVADSVAFIAKIEQVELPPDTVSSEVLDAVIRRLKHEEGFRRFQYNDSRDNPTIGYGTLLPLRPHELAHLGNRDLVREGIMEAEADWLLRGRLRGNANAFVRRWSPYHAQPFAVQVVLVDGSYQLGAAGLYRLENMLGFLAVGNYEAAAENVLETAWARETPARAEAAAAAFRAVSY